MIRTLALLFSVTSFLSIPAFAAETAAPATAHVNCVIFAWSETDGNVTKDILNSAFDLTLNQRTDLVTTATAKYQALLNKDGRIFIDVLNPAGSRIAAAFGEITIGTSLAEPGLQTQVFCFAK